MAITVQSARALIASCQPGALIGRFELGDRLGAFGYRDYRLVFFGQAVSSVGGWMQMVAQGWLVYALTGSSFYLSLVAPVRSSPGSSSRRPAPSRAADSSSRSAATSSASRWSFSRRRPTLPCRWWSSPCTTFGGASANTLLQTDSSAGMRAG